MEEQFHIILKNALTNENRQKTLKYFPVFDID